MTRKVQLSERLLKQWFQEFNQTYFNNELPEWKLTIITATSFLGKCCYRKQTIKISDYLNRDEKGFRQTLLHEMIHEWQVVNNLDLGHGESFKKKANELNKFGWNIHRCSSDNSEPLFQKKERQRSVSGYSIILKFVNHQGLECFSKMPLTNWQKLYDYAKRNPNRFRNPQVIKVPNTQEIQTFRKSGRLGYYYFDKWKSEVSSTFARGVVIAY